MGNPLSAAACSRLNRLAPGLLFIHYRPSATSVQGAQGYVTQPPHDYLSQETPMIGRQTKIFAWAARGCGAIAWYQAQFDIEISCFAMKIHVRMLNFKDAIPAHCNGSTS